VPVRYKLRERVHLLRSCPPYTWHDVLHAAVDFTFLKSFISRVITQEFSIDEKREVGCKCVTM